MVFEKASFRRGHVADPDEPWFGTVKGEFDAFDLIDGVPRLRLPTGRRSSFRLSRTELVLPAPASTRRHRLVGIDSSAPTNSRSPSRPVMVEVAVVPAMSNVTGVRGLAVRARPGEVLRERGIPMTSIEAEIG